MIIQREDQYLHVVGYFEAGAKRAFCGALLAAILTSTSDKKKKGLV